MHVLLEEVNGYFAEMGRLAVDLGNSTQKALLSADPEEAAQVAGDDDAMDNLHRHLFTVLMDDEWKHGVAAAVDVTLLGRFYERFADHPVEVSRRIIFQATGHGPDDDSLRAPTQCLPPPGHPRRTSGKPGPSSTRIRHGPVAATYLPMRWSEAELRADECD